ncbi:hypothetical protein D3C76_300800 [compost metagenome]
MLLGEVAQLDGSPQLNLSTIRLKLAGNQIQQSRFAAAVRPHNAYPVLRHSDIGQILNQCASIERFGQILHLDNFAAQSCRSHRDIQCARRCRALAFLQLLEAVDSGLLLRGTGLGSASDPGQLGAQQVLAFLLRRRFTLLTLSF